MYKICICDDDRFVRESLSKALTIYSFQNNFDFQIQESDSATKLLSSSDEYDIIFLDIQFDGEKNGIEVAKSLRRKGNDSIIVLITSHVNLSIKGYEAEAFRFVVKPFSATKIYSVLDSCLAKLESNRIIKVKTSDGVELVRANEIIYILSEARKREIYLEDGNVKSTWLSLKELYEALPSRQFQYAQKSFVVNLDKIKSINSNIITMNAGYEIPLSRHHKETFLSCLQAYMEEC